MLFSANSSKQRFAIIKNDNLGAKILTYGRINLKITKYDLGILNENKNLIDSIFSFADQGLQQTELQIGYKINSDIELSLFQSFGAYENELTKTKFYHEQHGISNKNSIEKVLPLFIAQSFHAIKIDIKYLVSYLILDEFLHGVGVKQRLNQGDAVRLPYWLIHGFCLESSSPWNAKDADEYLYFQERNFFKNVHKIPAEAQGVFGKYIWYNLLNNSNKNVVSTIWFTVKYTNQLNEAFLFQFKKSFDEWLGELPVIRDKFKLAKSDLNITKPFKQKVIQSMAAGPENIYLFLIRDEVREFLLYKNDDKGLELVIKQQLNTATNPWYCKKESFVKFDSVYQMFSVYERFGNKYKIEFYSSSGEFVKSVSGLINLSDINLGITLASWLKLKGNTNKFLRGFSGEIIDFKISEYSKIKLLSYGLVVSKSSHEQNNQTFENQEYLVSLIKFVDSHWNTIRVDTFDNIPVVGSFLTEQENRVSYTLSDGDNWKLQFIEINGESDFQWNTGTVISFFKHQKDKFDRILEYGYWNRWPTLSILSDWNESKKDIISLYKQSLANDSTETIKKQGKNKASELADSGVSFVSNFAFRSWSNKIKQQIINRYLGDFQTSSVVPSYYLKHAGVYLSNYENREFTYINKWPLNNLINSPFTPTIRLQIADKYNTHNINAMVFSNIVGNRMGMELEQKLSMGNDFELFHQLLWRNRNFISNENNYIKNSAIYTQLGIEKNWSKFFKTQFIGGLRYDTYFTRISNLSQSYSPFSQKTIVDFSGRIGLNSSPLNQTSLRRWNYNLEAMTGVTIFTNNTSINLNFNLQGNVGKSLGKFIRYNARCKARYSQGKIQTLYLLGGSDGWINNVQFIEKPPAIKTDVNFLMLGFAMPIRGFLFGTRVGTSFFGIQQQLEFDVSKALINNQIRNIFISDLILYPFWDAGLAFIGNSPRDLNNPYHTRTLSTGNYRLWYTSMHNPWISSFGMGIKTYIMGFPVKYEVTFPVMDKNFLKTQHLIGLQWEF